LAYDRWHEKCTALLISPSEWREAIERGKAALAAGEPGEAIAIFLRDIVRLPPWVRPTTDRRRERDRPAGRPPGRLRPNRGADRPAQRRAQHAHLGERIDALARTLPHAEKVVLHGQGHAANRTAPGDVARVIETLADKVLR